MLVTHNLGAMVAQPDWRQGNLHANRSVQTVNQGFPLTGALSAAEVTMRRQTRLAPLGIKSDVLW
jgi:hypothetical protein